MRKLTTLIPDASDTRAQHLMGLLDHRNRMCLLWTSQRITRAERMAPFKSTPTKILTTSDTMHQFPMFITVVS